MERETILQRITDIENGISQIQRILKTTKINFMAFPETYEQLTSEAAMKIERIACKFRHIIYSTTNITKPALMQKVSEAHGIEINYTDNIFSVTLPSLLPKKHKPMNSEFIVDPLYYALEKYCSITKIERFRECVVCFAHIYSEDTPTRRVKDYDNIEAKPVLDAVSIFVMVDDSGRFCNVYHMTEYGKKDCTEVTVMPKNMFTEWLIDHEKMQKNRTEFFWEPS
ncbi:MAG: DUF6100 family protein [Oscillospiraceae bacterium]|nr:DUF6100 family protein [Oscillospiraceae bacterium]